MSEFKRLRVLLILVCVSSSSFCEVHSSSATCPQQDADEVADSPEAFSLLQVQQKLAKHTVMAGDKDAKHTTMAGDKDAKHTTMVGDKDLVLMHIPYDFGHTIEKVAFLPANTSVLVAGELLVSFSGGKSFANPEPDNIPSWASVNKMMQPGGEAWGHFNPDLQVKSNATGCPIYLTPPKYWPEDVAKKYIGSKQVFGVLRDPYEKLVAQFRGDMADYGGSATKEQIATCDINNGVKMLLKKLDVSGDMFQGGCANLPQAEFFEGPYGITIPVDNWRFPQSANELFEAHGYPWYIEQNDVLHVSLCENSWAADLDSETRALARKLYAKDFELLCKHFGYCDFEENACLQGVQQMCPSSLFTWDSQKEMYCPTPGVNGTNVRNRQECAQLVSTVQDKRALQSSSIARSLGLVALLSLLGLQ